MKISLSLALLGVSSTLAKIDLSSIKGASNLNTIPNKFIVEVAAASDIPSKRDGTPHEHVYNSLRARKIKFHVHKEYDAPGLFLGAALELTDAKDVTAILNTAGVVAIHPIHIYSRPSPFSNRTVTVGDKRLPDPQAAHIETGVDKLHAKGLTGKGVKIAILDTGVDYTHPVLGGGFGEGFKVAGGFDFVGDLYFPGFIDAVPDPDPLDQCFGHGTHVAGIIGANPGNPYNISGIAYDATILAYRIFSCLEGTSDDIIIDAMLRAAVQDDADVLNLSLGGASGWTEGASNVVASRIAAMGKIVTISAGNEGDTGAWFSSSPANGIDVISVACSDSPAYPLPALTVQGAIHDPIVYWATDPAENPIFPFPVTDTLPIYATSNDTTVVDDACNPLPPSTPDLSGFAVLVRRGTCPFLTKITNIQEFNATVAIIYDNGDGFGGFFEVGGFPAVSIQENDGAFLANQYAAGVPIKVTFPQNDALGSFPDPHGGLISTFTSYGPTNDLYLKPSITAPGGNIVSTWPVPLGSYALESGTSMSAPFMAGVSGLLFQAKGKSAQVGRTARTLFQSTASFIPSSKAEGALLHTATQQGAGLIQAYDAIFATTILSRTELLLNDTAHFDGVQRFSVKNTGKSKKKYTVSHVPAGTALTVDPATKLPASGPVPQSSDFARVSFNSDKFTLYPGESHTVVATFKPPRNVDTSTFPVYSGFIDVTSGDETVHATYLGLAAALKDMQVIDDSDVILGLKSPLIIDTDLNIQTGPENYTLVGGDAPLMIWRQGFGSPILRLDLVPSSIKLNSTLNKRGRGPGISFSHSHKGGSFAKVPVVGSLLEMDYVPRNDQDTSLFSLSSFNFIFLSNTFANGTTIPPGSYKILLRSLRVTGDPTNEADYDSWLSPTIGVVPA